MTLISRSGLPGACNDMERAETIAAICSGAGGAIAIVRISGPDCLEIAGRAWRPLKKGASLAGEPRAMLLGLALGAEPCLAVSMPGPKSYTGEDVVEIHCHGGAMAPKRLLDAVVKAGARPAAPGEFTKRAFINGKMDLTQAEAVADLIDASSSMACGLAERQLSGALGKSLRALRKPLLDALAEVESRLDFPEEELDWKSPRELFAAVEKARRETAKLLDSRKSGALIRDGVRVAIAGRPNVGKSSLLNILLGYERAIVSSIPGTTRDTIEESASLHGIPLRITDTAGLRETDDHVEGLGVERSRKALRQAEIALWLLDASSKSPESEIAHMKESLPQGVQALAAWNKTDLCGAPEGLPDPGVPSVKISATKGEGVDKLLELVSNAVWEGKPLLEPPEAAVSARHGALLEKAGTALEEAGEELSGERWELAAAALREAVKALGEITGEDASPDVLDEIFSRFCIGK